MPTEIPITFHDKEFQEITDLLPFINHKDLSVSKANVGWHLSHSILVINAILNALKKSNPNNFKPKFNLLRTFAFTFSYFPRGRAKAPTPVVPSENISKESIEKQLVEIRIKLSRFDQFPPKAYFSHFIFGDCDRKQTKMFIITHTKHHLKIVRDILKKQN